MNLVDSSGWLEYFAKGPNGFYFAPVIQNSAELIVPTICLYEVFKRVVLLRGEEDALQVAGLMMTAMVVDLTQDIALCAAQLSLTHKLPMADSLILATARINNADLWTQDEHFKGLNRVQYFEKKQMP